MQGCGRAGLASGAKLRQAGGIGALSDQAFLREFESAAIPASRWMHRDHVRVAYLYLCELPFEDALLRLRAGITALNAANGVASTATSGYHETLTHAWARLVGGAVERPPCWPDFESFARANAALLDKQRLRDHYSKDRLLSPEARAAFVEPDLMPLIEPSPLGYRRARPSDVDYLAALFLPAMREAITAARGAWDDERETAQFYQQLELTGTRIIREGGVDIGFVMTRPVGLDLIQVHTLCFDAEHQRRGFGTAVLRSIMASAGLAGTTLEVSALKANARAQALYQRLGFQPFGETAYHDHMRWHSAKLPAP